MIRLYLLTFFILTTIFPCLAQVDTEFWFAPPEVSSGHGDSPIYLRISTLDKDATVRVIQPSRENRELANVVVPASTTHTINLSAELSNLETSVPASVMKTGIRIISSAPVTAYYEVGSAWNADIFALKGRNALGSKFVIPAQNFYDNSTDYFPTPYSSFDIVATANNTVIKIHPTKPVFGHTQEDVITVKLNAGETYSFRKTTTLAADNPAGTIVESTKPIAITIKDDSVINGGCRDLLGDQLVPVAVAGMEYVVLKGFLSTPEYLFITATEDNTEIFIGGNATPAANLNAGQVYRHPINVKSTYVLATKTIYVFHVTGFGCEMGLAILPSINCKGSQQIGFSRTTSEFFGLNVMVRKEGISHFRLNGASTLVPASGFTPVPGTNDKWYTAQFSFTTSQIPVGQASLISNDQHSFQLGIINGNAQTTCRYGYFSAFSSIFIGDDFDFCEGETPTIDAGPGKESYLWSTGATTQSIQINDSGEYWVKVEKEDCILYDTVSVKVKKGEVDLGPDIEICEGETTEIDGKENFSWHWSDGSTDRFISTSELGKYWVSVFDYTGCPASDTIIVSRLYHVFDESVQVKINRVSVDTTAEENIHLSWIVPEPERTSANMIFLYKRIFGADDWDLIASVPADSNLFTDTGNFTDDQVYEYYVSLSDPCVREQRFSNIHNTIRLTGIADTLTDVISFNWNHYQGWDAGVASYELWRKLDDQEGYSLISIIPGDQNSFSSVLGADGFDHNYVIRAVESSGNNESWSNNISFALQHPVYVPNIITPNGDEYNQFFYVSKIELYRNSELMVFDRWGSPVYKVRGYQNDWQGDGLSTGVYYYVLDLKRDNKILRGSLSIMR